MCFLTCFSELKQPSLEHCSLCFIVYKKYTETELRLSTVCETIVYSALQGSQIPGLVDRPAKVGRAHQRYVGGGKGSLQSYHILQHCCGEEMKKYG